MKTGNGRPRFILRNIYLMEARLFTRDECRELDRRAIEEFGISSLVLLENAGRGCVDVMERLGINGHVVILCGKGNNAGDGFVIARHLQLRGYESRVLLLSKPDELSGDAAANFAVLRHMDFPIFEAVNDFNSTAAGAAWIVDALLGTGAKGEPRPPFDAAIDWINARPATTKALAVDVPSGLNCDTGQPARHTVHADHTCTFVAMKIGFANSAAKPYIGTVHVCDIGVPPALLRDIAEQDVSR
jgi:NAD(P)H-hydrate epimerase